MAKFYSALPMRIKDVLPPTRRHLARLPDDFHVCLEFQINKDYDLVIVHPTGIHVIEVKNHTRIVEGGPQDAKWKVRNNDGTVVETPDNFYNQAIDAAAPSLPALIWPQAYVVCARAPLSLAACPEGKQD